MTQHEYNQELLQVILDLVKGRLNSNEIESKLERIEMYLPVTLPGETDYD